MDAKAALDPFVTISEWEWLGRASAGAGLGALLGYLAFAAGAPGLALLTSSLLGMAATLGATLALWPVEAKITLERQAEVVGARLLVAVIVYYGVGFVLLWALNQTVPGATRVPIAWEGPFLQPWQNPFFRRVTFWPFYALVLAGCSGVGPTPPGAC